MANWEWLSEDEDEIQRTFENIQFISCDIISGERWCNLYTKEGRNKLSKRPVYYGEITALDINTTWGSEIRSDIELNTMRDGSNLKINTIDALHFDAESPLECKLVRNKRRNEKTLYCQDAEAEG